MGAAHKQATWPPTYDQLCRRVCLLTDLAAQLTAELDVLRDRRVPPGEAEWREVMARVGAYLKAAGVSTEER